MTLNNIESDLMVGPDGKIRTLSILINGSRFHFNKSEVDKLITHLKINSEKMI